MTDDKEPQPENAEEVEQLIGDLEAHAAEENLTPGEPIGGESGTCTCQNCETGSCQGQCLE